MARTSKYFWLARDPEANSYVEVYVRKPKLDSSGWWDGDRFETFCSEDVAKVLGKTFLKPGECLRVRLAAE